LVVPEVRIGSSVENTTNTITNSDIQILSRTPKN